MSPFFRTAGGLRRIGLRMPNPTEWYVARLLLTSFRVCSSRNIGSSDCRTAHIETRFAGCKRIPAQTQRTSKLVTLLIEHDTRTVVMNLLAAVQAKNGAEVRQLYAAEVDFRLSWPVGELTSRVPWICPRHTADDMARHFMDIAENNCPHGEGTTIDAILVEGSDAVVFGTLRNRLQSNGGTYEARFALRLTVEKAQITRHHVYEDSLSIFCAFEQH